ncbi:MAG: MerR family DNA-binding transcriptional regulator [SAR92 clade bacterium]|jgi:DNA-binding transcriptional MerR regulator|uniref:MerR family DNA-binding transcriptional regulator n=1 Tax=SAR92 clade bacterium TaxID=2315479 RepID=A0A520MCD0_9GAMM|nr:MerR family DNA-binding transcriptional regulator [Porticoccaceae bacterium]RZO18867.1 MAG: MerR family DNA-binding transcriptional regulator [SAR92 clade bacterium]MDA8598260.1 MerR family DNA-binding transcriptional regulator [Porticoccaceae bacterium]MDA8878953.1 MerR family DNA-binding transcriptional regulator [Porticoccaceae bacterium]MDA8941088.1 MerR family DNA-binding transcriptional regulator [Porticoccaceae bacterium]
MHSSTVTVEYSISDLCKEFDITTRTIRHYEDLGLLSPSRRGQSRVYTPSDRTRLRLILRGKRLGLSLEDSRQIIDMYEPGKTNINQLNTLIDAIRVQRTKLNQQLDDISKLLKDLNDAEANCVIALKTNGQN